MLLISMRIGLHDRYWAKRLSRQELRSVLGPLGNWQNKVLWGRDEKTPALESQMTWAFENSSVLRQQCSHAQQWEALLSPVHLSRSERVGARLPLPNPAVGLFLTT